MDVEEAYMKLLDETLESNPQTHIFEVNHPDNFMGKLKEAKAASESSDVAMMVVSPGGEEEAREFVKSMDRHFKRTVVKFCDDVFVAKSYMMR